MYTVYGGTGANSELIPFIRTLAQVDDFSENTKVSPSSGDCEAPVPVKILIGMELDVSIDNDTEPSWMKGKKRSMTDFQGTMTSLTALA